jgi:hypothetical protein
MPIQEPEQRDLGRVAELMKSLRSGNQAARAVGGRRTDYAGWRLAGYRASGLACLAAHRSGE